jgi:superfamily II DNA or RNA helicase
VSPNPNQNSSSDEDLFVEIFQEAVGFSGVQSLQFQTPFVDVDGRPRYIDYALQSALAKYAFEVDGEYFHLMPATYRDGLVRQNSLVHQGWKVYRWTDVQLRGERDRIVEQLRLFLERELATGALDSNSVLPLQDGGSIEFLREHQNEALAALEELRSTGKTIALLTHATGTGKTHVAVSDARRCNYRTLYLAHTEKLPKQTAVRFHELWPEARTFVYKSGQHETACEARVVLSTFQAMARNLSRFNPREFGYIIVDEAHHAVADTFCEVVRRFEPRFLLGLTATPERSDDKSLLQVFRETAHRLSLEEAIQRGLLVPIRCLRVETNVDLRHVRFNGVDYRLKDLEQAIRVPGRDELIAGVYSRHAEGRRAVCFCVNVDHAERVAQVFRDRGIAAETVSGRQPVERREAVLASYEAGDVKVLCACDMLNEGWDSPKTEVLLMARPTLSKILYVQQLGRGTRVASGKEHLLVFDFVDRADRYAQALSLHRVFGKAEYRPGALVAAPDEQLAAENRAFETGGAPEVILGLHVYDTALQPIDIFRWQDEASGMMPASELARELRVDDDTVRQRIRREELVPDLTVPVGEREYQFFRRERLPELLAQYGVQPLSDENIRDEFLNFVEEGDMSASYKPVLLLGMLSRADSAGRVRVLDLVTYFRDFYADRQKNGLVVESRNVKMARVSEMSDLDIERTMLAMPFEKFERKSFFRRLKDLAYVRFTESLWRKLSEGDLARLEQLAAEQLAKYYERLALRSGDGTRNGTL